MRSRAAGPSGWQPKTKLYDYFFKIILYLQKTEFFSNSPYNRDNTYNRVVRVVKNDDVANGRKIMQIFPTFHTKDFSRGSSLKLSIKMDRKGKLCPTSVKI